MRKGTCPMGHATRSGLMKRGNSDVLGTTSILVFTYEKVNLIYISSESQRRRLEHTSDVLGTNV